MSRAQRTLQQKSLALATSLLLSLFFLSTPSAAQLDDDEHEAGYWENGEERWFASGSVALGALNTAELNLGYGRPHWLWAGVKAYALTTFDFGAIGIGPQLDLLIANALFRVRRTWSYANREPLQADSYSEAQLTDPSLPRAQYTALDANIWGYVPAGPTLGLWGIRGVYLPNFPETGALFSEFLRMTLNENRALMPRLIWWFKLLDDSLLIGPASDMVLTPERPVLVRVGGSAVYSFGPHLQLQLLLTVPVTSPDELGWFSQSWGTGRLQWTWASQEATPSLL